MEHFNEHFITKLRRNDEILTDLMDYLTKFQYNEEFVTNQINDGRTISLIGERDFVMPLIQEWINKSDIVKLYSLSLVIPAERQPYDVLFIGSCDEDEIYIPCNIKISSCTYFDNLNIQNIQNMLCFGEKPTTANMRKKTQEKHLKDISQDKTQIIEPMDYYFIVIHKKDMSKSFFTSALSVSHPYFNGPNLVQCNWGTERANGREVAYPITEDDIREDKKRGLTPRKYRSYISSINLLLNVTIYSYELAIATSKIAIKNTKKLMKLAEKARKKFNICEDNNGD